MREPAKEEERKGCKIDNLILSYDILGTIKRQEGKECRKGRSRR